MEGKQAKAIGQEEPAYARINGVPIDLYSDNIYGVLRELCKNYEYSSNNDSNANNEGSVSILEVDSKDKDIEGTRDSSNSDSNTDNEDSDSVLEADSEDDDIEEIILNGNEIFDNKDM